MLDLAGNIQGLGAEFRADRDAGAAGSDLTLEQRVQRIAGMLNLATQRDLRSLQRRIRHLECELREAEERLTDAEDAREAQARN